MVGALIRVREFAQSCGCTPQNIYGHLKKYAAELEGHTLQGKGRQGVLLDEYAQEFLRSVMYPKEVTIADTALEEELNAMRAEILRVGQENLKLGAALLNTETERDKAQLEVKHFQRLLADSENAEKERAQEVETLKADLDAAQAEITALRGRKWYQLLFKKGG